MPVQPTWIRWYNDDEGAKIACVSGSYEALPYGSVSDLEFYAEAKPPHPEHGQFQWGIACSKTSRVIVADIDKKDAWIEGNTFVAAGYLHDIATSVREDGERAHVVIEVPEELLHLWPRQGPTCWGDVKSNGFSYIEGVHHSGMRYVATGLPWLVADAELLTALTEDRIFPQGKGATGVMAGPWEQEGYVITSHDEAVATIMSMVAAGLDEDEIYDRLEVIMPNRDGDWPDRGKYIAEKIRSASRKIVEREERDERFWRDLCAGLGTSPEEVAAGAQAAWQARQNATPASLGNLADRRNQAFIAAGRSMRHLTVAQRLNWAGIPVEHRVTTDSAIARDIAEEMRPCYMYAMDEDTWYQNDGERWTPLPKDFGAVIVAGHTENLKSVAALDDELQQAGTASTDEEIAADDSRRERLVKNWMKLNSNSGQNAVGNQLRTVARSNPRYHFEVADLDAEPHILWAGGHPWNLLDPGLSLGEANQVHLKSAACLPVPGPSPAWDQVLEAAWPDPDVRAWAVREIAGLMLWGTTSKTHPVLDGPPSSGKSTFALILTRVLGSYAVQVSPDKILSADMSAGADEEIAAMIGARCVWMDEPPPQNKQAVSRFNDLASGTGSLSAARKYHNRVTAPKRFNFLICQNPRNALRMDAQGVSERMLYIPCNGVPSKTEAAWQRWCREGEAEYPAILASLMRECALYRTGQRFEIPLAAMTGRMEAQERSDEFGTWLLENYEIMDPATQTVDTRLDYSPTVGSLRTLYNDSYARANALSKIGAAEARDQLGRLGVRIATGGHKRRKDVVFVTPRSGSYTR